MSDANRSTASFTAERSDSSGTAERHSPVFTTGVLLESTLHGETGYADSEYGADPYGE